MSSRGAAGCCGAFVFIANELCPRGSMGCWHPEPNVPWCNGVRRLWIRVQQDVRRACTGVHSRLRPAVRMPCRGASVVCGDGRLWRRVGVLPDNTASVGGACAAAKPPSTARNASSPAEIATVAFAAAPFATLCAELVSSDPRRCGARCIGDDTRGVCVRWVSNKPHCTGDGPRRWRDGACSRCLPPAADKWHSRCTGASGAPAVDVSFDIDSLDGPDFRATGSRVEWPAHRCSCYVMNVGPLASLEDEQIDSIVKSAAASFAPNEPYNRSDIEFVAVMAVAATGGHLAVQDSFFFDCHREISVISPKKLPRWKTHCSDASGTRRNVVVGADGLLRVRDDVGRLAPLVPASISKTVNGTDDFSSWMERSMPRFLRERALEAAISAPAPPPKVVVGERRCRKV